MKRRIMVAGLVLALGVTVSQGEWTMHVHRGGDVQDIRLSDIDSLTFSDVFSPPSIVTVPMGDFTMGDGVFWMDCGRDEREVTLTRDFYLGQHEVTNQEYMDAVQWAYDLGYVTVTLSYPATVWDNLDGSTKELLELSDEDCEIAFDGEGFFYMRESSSDYAQWAYPDGYDPSNHAVKEVTWYGAARYCDWLSLQSGLPRAYEHSGDWACNGGDPYGALGYRLPTDAEWEYAAQYDDERRYPWGDEYPDCSRANYWEYPNPGCVGWTTDVGSYPDAPEAVGISDMAGSVYEWCNDWFVCDLGTTPVTDPSGPVSGTHRVARGGFWGNPYLHCGYRTDLHPLASGEGIGFRIARTANAQ